MKKSIFIVISGLILIIAFAYFIYPTQYTYLDYEDGYVQDGKQFLFKTPMRINLFTRKTERFDEEQGWIKVPE